MTRYPSKSLRKEVIFEMSIEEYLNVEWVWSKRKDILSERECGIGQRDR